jgi:nicotinamide-nucleotide amidase
MPGVPTEMHRMWKEEVRPELERRATGEVLVTRTIKTLGIGEGTVDDMAKPLYATPGIGIGTYARADGVHLRIGAKARTREEAWQRIHPVEEELDRIFGAAIWGKDDDTLEGHVHDLFSERRMTLAVMESCTGGLLSSVLTDVPGAGDYFRGGIVTYWTDLKVDSGVDPAIITEYGVISAETAAGMAMAVRERVGADFGVGITGVAGPDPEEGKPPGTVHIAVAGPEGVLNQSSMSLNSGREAVKRRAVTTAMLLLRRTLLEAKAE